MENNAKQGEKCRMEEDNVKCSGRIFSRGENYFSIGDCDKCGRTYLWDIEGQFWYPHPELTFHYPILKEVHFDPFGGARFKCEREDAPRGRSGSSPCAAYFSSFKFVSKPRKGGESD